MNAKPVTLPEMISPAKALILPEDKVHGVRPRLVMAYARSAYAVSTSHHFGRLGWDVYLASSGHEARSLTRRVGPAAVVLGTELPDESGWLTCNKLLSEHSGLKVILVTADETENGRRFAAFVGAARLVSPRDGVAALVDEIYDTTLAAAS